MTKKLIFSEKFGMLMLGSYTYFLKVSAPVSKKVVKEILLKIKNSENLTFTKLLFKCRNEGVPPKTLKRL